jgi:hypothetical protein
MLKVCLNICLGLVTWDGLDVVGVALSWIVQMVITSKICGTLLKMYEFYLNVHQHEFCSTSGSI